MKSTKTYCVKACGFFIIALFIFSCHGLKKPKVNLLTETQLSEIKELVKRKSVNNQTKSLTKETNIAYLLAAYDSIQKSNNEQNYLNTSGYELAVPVYDDSIAVFDFAIEEQNIGILLQAVEITKNESDLKNKKVFVRILNYPGYSVRKAYEVH
jgi:hypothetical protein